MGRLRELDRGPSAGSLRLVPPPSSSPARSASASRASQPRSWTPSPAAAIRPSTSWRRGPPERSPSVFAPFLPELDGAGGDMLGLLRRTSEAVRERVEEVLAAPRRRRRPPPRRRLRRARPPAGADGLVQPDAQRPQPRSGARRGHGALEGRARRAHPSRPARRARRTRLCHGRPWRSRHRFGGAPALGRRAAATPSTCAGPCSPWRRSPGPSCPTAGCGCSATRCRRRSGWRTC